MKLWLGLVCLLLVSGCSHTHPQQGGEIVLFDGKTFQGWDGDTERTWRIDHGDIVAGDAKTMVPRNEFLATTRSFKDFILKVDVKLTGGEGFVNAGVQVRSERAKQPENEMVGYQCDVGEGWWGALYDETRRNKVLVKPEEVAVKQAVRKGEWNHYEIRCEGRRVRTWINGIAMIDYTEADESLAQVGRVGLQVHGGGRTEVRYRNIRITPLP